MPHNTAHALRVFACAFQQLPQPVSPCGGQLPDRVFCQSHRVRPHMPAHGDIICHQMRRAYHDKRQISQGARRQICIALEQRATFTREQFDDQAFVGDPGDDMLQQFVFYRAFAAIPGQQIFDEAELDGLRFLLAAIGFDASGPLVPIAAGCMLAGRAAAVLGQAFFGKDTAAGKRAIAAA